jgi:2-dehydro-3-deoxygluconokinase
VIIRRGGAGVSAAGALAVTMLTDYAQTADEEQVWSIWECNTGVKR